MQEKSIYRYQGIMSLLHEKGIDINFKRYDARLEHLGKHIDEHTAMSFDCTTRALCAVLNRTYGEIFSEQLSLAKKLIVSTNSNAVTQAIAKAHGYLHCEFVMPMTVLKLYLIRLKGRYILGTNSNHVFAYIDGTIYDRDLTDYSSDFEQFDKDEINEETGIVSNDALYEAVGIEENWCGYIYSPIVEMYYPEEEHEFWNNKTVLY